MPALGIGIRAFDGRMGARMHVQKRNQASGKYLAWNIQWRNKNLIQDCRTRVHILQIVGIHFSLYILPIGEGRGNHRLTLRQKKIICLFFWRTGEHNSTFMKAWIPFSAAEVTERARANEWFDFAVPPDILNRCGAEFCRSRTDTFIGRTVLWGHNGPQLNLNHVLA